MSLSRYPEIFETLLEERGIKEEEKEAYLHPDYERLHDPLLLPDMAKAVARIHSAIENKEHIVIFSDYDADGIPAAVVLSDFFKRIGYENISFYIPHRHDEGFGLNLDAIKECAKRVKSKSRPEGSRILDFGKPKSGLMITLDCGIADIEEVILADELGLDVIITDHHEPGETLPRAFAIVNPKLKDCKYPFRDICGSGVAYKLVQALLAKNSFGVKPGMEKWSLDMVGIATLSDMVPLVGENRILARFGLEVLRKSPRPGLAALLENLGIDRRNLTEDDITFSITPRINVASRLGVPEDAFRLLSTNDEVEAKRLAAHLEKINNERKGIVASMVKEAKSHLKKRESIKDVIVIGNPEWRPALLGLVCNSLVEEYARPVFCWGRDGDNVLKGSCRSYNGYDLFELMSAAKDSFIEFGGHKGAGGFSVTLKSLTTLEEKLSKALSSLTMDTECPQEGISLNLSDIGESLWQTISLFAPFGTGNEKPIFKIKNAPIKAVRQFGKENNHLELSLSNGLKAISFFSSLETYKLTNSQTSATLLAHLEKSYYRSRPELRLRIVDILEA